MSIWNKFASFFTGSTPVPKPAPRPVTKPAPTVKVPNTRAEPAPRIREASPEAQLNATGSVKVLTRNETARIYYRSKMWRTLVAFKRKQKKGWAALGFTPNEIQEIKLHVGE